MVTAPVRAPAASGVKVTLNVQVAPAASEEAQAEVNAKSPFTVIEEIARGAVPVLVKVTVCAGLVVEIVRDANANEDGVSVRPAASATGVTAFEGAEAGPTPNAFTAVTVKVYAVPFASPVTVIGEAEPVPLMPPGLEVTTYPMIAEPPLLAGGVKATEACALPALAVPMVGAPGTVAGVTEFDGAEAGPGPTAFVAVTVKVYAVPFASPVTVIGEAAPVAVMPLGLEVTV